MFFILRKAQILGNKKDFLFLKYRIMLLFSLPVFKAELNTKISNTIFSNVQAISDKAYVDYKRIYKYSLDDLDELKVSRFFLFVKLTSKLINLA